MRRHILNILLILLLPVYGFASNEVDITDSINYDKVHIEIVTCSPGTETYSKYGHTAVRVYNLETHEDYVYNYGLFSFNTHHFYLKFVRGETYYLLGRENTAWFWYASEQIGRTMLRQHLDLDNEQKRRIIEALEENRKPENCQYLYNFVFDNCATRPYRLMSEVIDFNINPQELTNQTFREAVRHYSEHNSWAGAAIDFIFGKDADRCMTKAESLFLPENLMWLIETTNDHQHKLCDYSEAKHFKVQSHAWFGSPNCVVLLLCLLIALITCWDLSKMKHSWWFDSILFATGAVLGVLTFYLSFFSIHPLVKHNYNMLIICPLLVVPMFMYWFKTTRQWMIRQGELLLAVCMMILFFIRVFVDQSWHSVLWIPLVHAIRLALLNTDLSKLKLMRKRYLLLFLVSLVAFCSSAQPRLKIVVAVEGLDQTALNELQNFWRQGGLRTITEQGQKVSVAFQQEVYGGTETLATILTGVEPNRHGVASDNYFNRTDRLIHSVYEDPTVIGINTELHLSPVKLQAATAADDFRLQTDDMSRIYAIGVSPQATLLLGGHAANSVAWIDPKQKQWASTSYYDDGLPAAADKINMSGHFAEIGQRHWQPRLSISNYMHPTAEEQKREFDYSVDKYLTNTPLANTLVVELALDIQKQEKLGQNRKPDMLLLQLTTVTPKANSDRILSAEQEDMYLSLNQDLGYLLEQLDKRIGEDAYELLLVGYPHFGAGVQALERAKLKTRYFNTERAAALCNTYLMALLGKERWIDGGYGHSIYINRRLLEEKDMTVEKISTQIRDFLLEFEGTDAAFLQSDMHLLPLEGETKRLHYSMPKQQMGDIIITLQPFFVIGEKAGNCFDNVVETEPTSPLFLYKHDAQLPQTINANEIKQYINTIN